MAVRKCYIYTRVSTAAQTEGYSLEAQQESLGNMLSIVNLRLSETTAMQVSPV